MYPVKQLKKIVLLVLSCLACGHIVAQSDFKFIYPRQTEKIVFKKVRGLMVVQASINNKGPFNLILDTGVGIFLITDPTLRDSLTIKYLKKITISGLGEQPDIQAHFTPTLKVQIGNTIADELPAAILDDDVFNLSAYAGIPIHGLIGYNFFASFIVHIFYETQRINLYTNNLKKISKRYTKTPITIENNKPYCQISAETTSKKKYAVKMLIDTGAGHVVSLETYNDVPFPLPTPNIAANLGIGLGGNIGGFLGRLNNIKIAKFTLNKPICAFPNYKDVALKSFSIARNGSIGNVLLKKFNVIFDYQNGFVYLKPNINFKSVFEHDMSGLEVFASGQNLDRIFVNRVEPNSPAEEIGLQKNDELRTINLKKVKEMSLEDIIALFQSQNNKNLFIEYEQNKTLKRAIITLKRRI
ncbi:MAG: peptide-binding protein [Sphingobacteriales bacterium]|nr:MAG: peptide-binding protein [Sphingobacteriales bacterium]TAF82291.1 MAG: peptide-binding protein [Sphingobacteriales bacterium]